MPGFASDNLAMNAIVVLGMSITILAGICGVIILVKVFLAKKDNEEDEEES